MSKKRFLIMLGILSIAMLALAACAGEAGPQGEPGPQGEVGPQGEPGPMPEAADLTCTDCHNDTALITGKQTAWSASQHGNGTAYDYAGGRTSCAGCHSGAGFSERVAAGIGPDKLETVSSEPTRQDCRACHQIHTTYTKDDFALETTEAVNLLAFEGMVYDGGEGNLCAQCHQPRRGFPEAVDGTIEVTSTHWGPHHGGQGSMILGIAGAGPVEGKPSKHYSEVEDTCVTCHLGPDNNHKFQPQLVVCQECHDGAENFDIDGTQTEIQALLDELEELLIAAGLLDEEGHPAIMVMPADQGAALWNWIYIAHEDKSLGVHNPSYTKALLEWSIAILK